jgi:glucose-6-phosphate dehydrogenase assembly protein OpcA
MRFAPTPPLCSFNTTRHPMATPLVALQKPKDISVAQIEAELATIWRSQQTDQGSLASRSATFSMVIYEPEEFQQTLAGLGFYKAAIDGSHGPQTKAAIKLAQGTYGLTMTGRVDIPTLEHLREAVAEHGTQKITNADLRGFGISDAIASQNPCRILTLCPGLDGNEPLSAQVSAYCPINKRGESSLMCCEYVTLRGSKANLQSAGEMVTSLLIQDLPKFTWWKATPNQEQPLFQALAAVSDCMIFDSCYFSDPEMEFRKLQDMVDRETYVADLNWHRLSAWQELTAAAYDAPNRRSGLLDIDRVSIDYEKGNPAQGWMFLAWLASRLQWSAHSYSFTDGDYDIREISFTASNHKEVIVELVGVPVSDWGEIPGDLIGVKLASVSNPKADCSTILCSETTGCMRLESGGGAQNAKTEQVMAPTDEKAEELMSQQLQSWGRDMLYEESLAMIVQILKLRA